MPTRERRIIRAEEDLCERASHRVRVQQHALQRTERGATQASGAEEALTFLIAFVRHLLSSVSGDQIFLAVVGAARDVGITQEKAMLALKSMDRFQKRRGMWPEGFMP